MCLSKLEDFTVTQNYGWQVFNKEITGELYPCFFGDDPIPVGKWHKDKFRICDRWIRIDVDVRYKKGFHIFLNKEDAKTYGIRSAISRCVKKVRFKRILARGLQEIHSPPVEGKIQTQQVKVVVCRKRFVEPN